MGPSGAKAWDVRGEELGTLYKDRRSTLCLSRPSAWDMAGARNWAPSGSLQQHLCVHIQVAAPRFSLQGPHPPTLSSRWSMWSAHLWPSQSEPSWLIDSGHMTQEDPWRVQLETWQGFSGTALLLGSWADHVALGAAGGHLYCHPGEPARE